MSEQLTGSWKKHFDIRFLAGEDLEKPFTLTIKSVIRDKVFNKKLNTHEPVNALIFEETEKLMALNKTNSRMISELVGTQRVEKWPGNKIILEQKIVKAFGETHKVIRVKNKIVKNFIPEQDESPGLKNPTIHELQKIVANTPQDILDQAWMALNLEKYPDDTDADGWNRLTKAVQEA